MTSGQALPRTPESSVTRHVSRGILTVVAASMLLMIGARPSDRPAPFGTGPGAWPVAGAIYEVSPEYFPNHSINEITARIPVLQKLGISVLYITPIFQCAGTSQYLILDYYVINPRYGTEADLSQLVKVAHQHGIRVLLDLVTSLTPEGSFIMTKHPDWLMRGIDGKVAGYYPFPEWGTALDGANPGLIDYFAKVARYYVEKFDIDGWRADSPMNNYDPAKVSGDHNRVALLRTVKTAITSAKKDGLMMTEITGPEIAWNKDDRKAKPLFDEMCEVSYNYDTCGFLGGLDGAACFYVMFDGAPGITPFHPTILSKVATNQATSKEFVDRIKGQRVLFDRLRANFIEDHDTARVSKCFPKQHQSLFALVATIPGVPVVHAGQEVGSTVHPDASGNTNVLVDWAKGDSDLEAYYAHVLKVRANNQALISGDIRDVWKAGDKAIAYLRTSGDSRVLVALNFDPKPVHFTVDIPAAELGLASERVYGLRDELTGNTLARQGKLLGYLDLDLPPYGRQIISISLQ
jgi:cyclomaltodextrinase / maltogenic alpha-amylase / neopullulanase